MSSRGVEPDPFCSRSARAGARSPRPQHERAKCPRPRSRLPRHFARSRPGRDRGSDGRPVAAWHRASRPSRASGRNAAVRGGGDHAIPPARADGALGEQKMSRRRVGPDPFCSRSARAGRTGGPWRPGTGPPGRRGRAGEMPPCVAEATTPFRPLAQTARLVSRRCRVAGWDATPSAHEVRGRVGREARGGLAPGLQSVAGERAKCRRALRRRPRHSARSRRNAPLCTVPARSRTGRTDGTSLDV